MNKKIQELAIHNKDTGSSEIQIALLTDKIETLSIHIKKFKKINILPLDCWGPSIEERNC